MFRFKLFTFTSKDRSGSLLEFSVSGDKPVNAVSRRIGFQSGELRKPRTRPQLTALSIFEFFRKGDES